MSDISDRIMRGQYVSKAECFDHAEEVERVLDAYQRAMAAMAEHERLMSKCRCEYDGDVRDDGTPYSYRIPVSGCPVHAEEDEDGGEPDLCSGCHFYPCCCTADDVMLRNDRNAEADAK